MSNPTTNHIFGQMQHAEYEASIRKYQTRSTTERVTFNLDITGKIAALIKKAQLQFNNQADAKLATNN